MPEVETMLDEGVLPLHVGIQLQVPVGGYPLHNQVQLCEVGQGPDQPLQFHVKAGFHSSWLKKHPVKKY